MNVGIVFALSIEAGCFVDTLSQIRVTRGDGFIARQGRRGHREVVLVESGPGGPRAAMAAQALIDAYRPRLMVSAGFAGGLDALARRQDLVVATSLTRLPSPSGRGAGGEGSEMTLDPAGVVPWLDEVPDLHRGRLITCDRVIRLREEKQNWAGGTRPWRSIWRPTPWPRFARLGRSIFWRFARSATRLTMSFRAI